MTLQLKTSPDLTAFDLALQDWLSGNISGHLSPFMYTEDSDDHRWKNGHSSQAYYVGRDEKATFDLACGDLNLLVENFIDLGPGGEASVLSKSLPIAKETMAANYLPIDLSPTMAYAAAQTITKTLNIEATPIIGDFFESFQFNKPNALITLLGLTFANLETYDNQISLQHRLVQILSNYRRAVTGSSFFLVSFDANTNAQEIIGCYNNNEFGDLIRSCIDRAIDTSDFEYHVRWTPENYQLATGLRSTRDQMVAFNDARFAVEQDEFLPILNSYRFPVSFVTDAAAKAGWEHLKTWSATGRVHYVLFRTK